MIHLGNRLVLLCVVVLLIAIVVITVVLVEGRNRNENFRAPTIYNGVRMSGAEWAKLYAQMDQAEKDSLNYAVDGTICSYNEEVKRDVCDLLVQSNDYMAEHGYDLAPGLSSQRNIK